MTTIFYDGSFQGLLTVVFEVFEYKYSDVEIFIEGHHSAALFGTTHSTITNENKAVRVWKGLSQKITKRALSQFYKTYLSEEKGVEVVLLQYVQYALKSNVNIENDFSNSTVLYVTQTSKKVDREKHRMEAFIRFQLTKDNLYYASCQPDFNVLPLIEKHFKERYADQHWLIYDIHRKYGIYYDLNSVSTIDLVFSEDTGKGKSLGTVIDEKESLYQQLWQQYFTSVNIVARKNMKLHIQHMPKRYWSLLTEKQPTLK